MGAPVAVQVAGHQLGIGIARAAAHAAQGGVNGNVPHTVGQACKLLAEGKAHLQVVVAVEAHAHAGGQMLVDEPEHPGQVLGVHTAEGIHGGKGVRPDLVHIRDQVQQLFVRIAQNVHRLHIELVALALDLTAEVQHVLALFFKEAGPHAVNAGAVVRLQIGDVVAAVVRQADIAHAFPALPGQIGADLGRVVVNGAAGAVGLILQKAHLHHVQARIGHASGKALHKGLPEHGVHQIAAVPQGAVQQLNARFH